MASMALIECPECGKDVSDKAPSCPNCGAPILVESKVIVYGYTQQFLINPKVEVFWKDQLVGAVGKGDFLEFVIDVDGEVHFKMKWRKASLPVKSEKVNKIKISWDRITGKMIPQHVEFVTPD